MDGGRAFHFPHIRHCYIPSLRCQSGSRIDSYIMEGSIATVSGAAARVGRIGRPSPQTRPVPAGRFSEGGRSGRRVRHGHGVDRNSDSEPCGCSRRYYDLIAFQSVRSRFGSVVNRDSLAGWEERLAQCAGPGRASGQCAGRRRSDHRSDAGNREPERYGGTRRWPHMAGRELAVSVHVPWEVFRTLRQPFRNSMARRRTLTRRLGASALNSSRPGIISGRHLSR